MFETYQQKRMQKFIYSRNWLFIKPINKLVRLHPSYKLDKCDLLNLTSFKVKHLIRSNY